MTSPTTTAPANTLPAANAYYCCNCRFGPMLFAVHPACIECGKPACSYCGVTTLAANPEYLQQPAQDFAPEPTPRDPYGAVLGFDNHSESTLLRYLHDEPGVSERLASGAERASLADAEAELDAMMRRYGYSARTGVEKL